MSKVKADTGDLMSAMKAHYEESLNNPPKPDRPARVITLYLGKESLRVLNEALKELITENQQTNERKEHNNHRKKAGNNGTKAS